MNTFRNPGSFRATAQAAMYYARKRNRMARAPESPTGATRERLPIDTAVDIAIDNPDEEGNG